MTNTFKTKIKWAGIVIAGFVINSCVSDPPYPTQQLEQVTVENSEDIIANDEWKSNEIHIITTNITVDRSVLRIQAGTQVRFKKNASLTIGDNAGLIADGTNNEIEFTGVTKNKGHWKYILFKDGAIDDSCSLIGCSFKNGGGDNDYPAMIICENASPTIRGCKIDSSAGSGLILKGDCGQVQFFNNTVSDCDLSPIQCDASSVDKIGANTYLNNQLNVIQVNDKNIRQNTTWFQQSISIPLLFEHGLNIQNARLTLTDGLELQYRENQSLIVENGGALHADGALASINFSGFGGQYWNGIIFKETANSSDSHLINCTVENGGQDAYSPGNISLFETAPEIIGCRLKNSYRFGAYLKGRIAPANFSGNYFSNNLIGAISLSANSLAELNPQTFEQPENTRIELRGGQFEEPISSDIEWTKLGIPYQINDKIRIEFATLTIEHGVTLIMLEHSGFQINREGGLVADGSSSLITIKADVPNPGFWDYIYFSPNANQSNCKLINCKIQYGGGDPNFPGMIYCDNSEPVIRNCFIEHSKTWGIYLNGNITIPDLTTNYFIDNVYGDYYQTP